MSPINNQAMRKQALHPKRMLSLLEMMVSMVVIAIISGMIGTFLYTSSLSLTYANQNLLVYNSLRVLSELFTRDAGICDFFVLYKTANSSDRTTASQRLGPGEWGDMIAFIRLGPPIDNGTGVYERPISKIFVLERVPPSGNEIWKYTIDVPASDGFKAVEALLPAGNYYLGVNSGSTRIAHTGEWGDSKRMIYNIDGKTLMANLELYHKYREQTQSVSLNFLATCPVSF